MATQETVSGIAVTVRQDNGKNAALTTSLGSLDPEGFTNDGALAVAEALTPLLAKPVDKIQKRTTSTLKKDD